MILDKHTNKEKAYIKAQKRLNEIWREITSLPYVKLKKPYQSGWWLIITFRDDFARSDKGILLKPILEKLRENYITRSPKIVSQVRKDPSLESVRSKIYNTKFYRTLNIKTISKKEYEQLDKKYQKYFSIDEDFTNRNKPIRYSFIIPSHYLIVKVEKRMIIRIRDINPKLEKERDELSKFLKPYWRKGHRYRSEEYAEKRSERRKTKIALNTGNYE